MMRSFRSAWTGGLAAVCLTVGSLAVAPTAGATDWVYLLNVTVRPVYGFTNAEQALSYGYGICDRIRQGRGYPQLAADLKTDFSTNDEFSVSYLLSQATQELCPELIWQLRSSAGGYRPAA